jgi:hypothetical protein
MLEDSCYKRVLIREQSRCSQGEFTYRPKTDLRSFVVMSRRSLENGNYAGLVSMSVPSAR